LLVKNSPGASGEFFLWEEGGFCLSGKESLFGKASEQLAALWCVRILESYSPIQLGLFAQRIPKKKGVIPAGCKGYQG